MPEKLAMSGGKVLFYNNKPQFGCVCCCLEPDYQNLWPADNDYIFVTPQVQGRFKCSVEVKYTDTIELYVSTNGGASYDLVAETGRGSNPVDGTPDPTYNNTWTEVRLQARVSVDSYVSQTYAAGTTIYWKLKLTNDCGAAEVWTVPRIYRYITKGTSERVDCNSCGPQLKKNYTATLSGLDAIIDAAADFTNFVPYMMPSVQSTPLISQNCAWNRAFTDPQDLWLYWLGGLSTWEMAVVYDPDGLNTCFARYRIVGDPCVVPASFSWSDIHLSSTSACSGADWSTLVVTVA